MMNINEKGDRSTHQQTTEKSYPCYICGKETREGELCYFCAKIISTSLNALCLDDEASDLNLSNSQSK